jgi:branched-chain amino acid transport system permease protein
MDGGLLAQEVANGVVVGLGYALVAVGLTIMLKTLDAVNFAHGEVYLVGGLATFVGTSALGLPFWVAALAAVVAATAVGIVIYLLVGRVLRQDVMNVLLATFAVSIIIQQAASMMLDGRSRSVATPWDQSLHLGPVTVTVWRVVLVVVALVGVLSTHLVVHRTGLGRQIRAVAQNQLGAQVVGVSFRKVALVVFLLSSVLAGLAGMLLVPIQGVSALQSVPMMIKGFVVIVLGGIGSVGGALAGGLLLGLVETVGATHLGSEWTDGFGYLLLLLVLVLRPHGLSAERV